MVKRFASNRHKGTNQSNLSRKELEMTYEDKTDEGVTRGVADVSGKAATEIPRGGGDVSGKTASEQPTETAHITGEGDTAPQPRTIANNS